MKKLAGSRALCAALLAITASTAAGLGGHAHAANGGDALRISTSRAVCTGQGTGSVALNQSGRRITLAVNASGVAPAPGWHVTVTDLQAGVVARSVTGATGSQWTSVVGFTSVRGARTIVIDYSADNGSNRCVATLAYRG